MKTFDKKDVFSWSNAEDAKQYIGKQGYFANTITQLRDSINKNEVYILCKIFEDVGNCFYTTESSHSIGYDFFLPADKVKEVEEKKYRPFKSIDEFLNFYKVGQVIHIKHKSNNLEQLTSIVAIFIRCYCCVCLGTNNNALPFEDLFKKYEIEINGKWQAFGVLEND